MNQRAAARYDITLVEAKSPAGFHLNVKINEAFDQWASISEGAYALKTDLTDWSDEKLWRAYIQLAQAEAAFRVQKAPRRAWQLPAHGARGDQAHPVPRCVSADHHARRNQTALRDAARRAAKNALLAT